jgi:hypothetical protein
MTERHKGNTWKENLLLFAVLLICVLLITDAMGILPQQTQDTIKWFGDNAWLFAVTACFMVACYVVLRLKRGRHS